MSPDLGQERVTFTKAAIRVKTFHEDRMNECVVKGILYDILLVVISLA